MSRDGDPLTPKQYIEGEQGYVLVNVMWLWFQNLLRIQAVQGFNGKPHLSK